jgi:hypothetical protein
MDNHTVAFLDSATAVAHLGESAAEFAVLLDGELMAALDLIARHRRHLDTYAAWAAGEVAARSRFENGYAGLAQREGFANAVALIRSRSQTTHAEASKQVALGTMLAATATPATPATPATQAGPPRPSARADAIGACHDGRVSADGIDAIRRGLGETDAAVGDDLLSSASERLLAEADGLSADHLLRRARQLRDELDAEGIARRERERRDARSVTRWVRRDGMYQVSAVLDPESGRTVFAAFEEILSPRRGGPRFVDPVEQERQQAIIDDPRTDAQLAADALVEMIRIASAADASRMFGRSRPSVRVIVTETALADRPPSAHGYIEAVLDPVSIETVERHLCATGAVGVMFDDDGQCLNVGREKRLFTARQRIGLAIRDGGCLFGDCDRPASWCEAHHIRQWSRDRGSTDIADGVLLCRFHHLLVHNNHWEILRDDSLYWLKPPRCEDPAQTLIALPSKSPVMAEVARARPVS